MSNYFTDRRTCRKFTERPVEETLLESLMEQASHAPTTGNMQLYSVVVTRDPEARKALASLHFNQPAATGAPLLLTFCADLKRFSEWCRISAAEPCYDNLQGLTTAFLDAVIFAQQFNTVAEMEGLGCCYLGTTTYNSEKISELLALPDLVVPVTTLAVGYPEQLSEDCGRLPVKAIVHHEKYHHITPEWIEEVYAEKEAREDSQRFIAENSKRTLAQVFTEVRYTREMMEGTSDSLLALVRSKGFAI